MPVVKVTMKFPPVVFDMAFCIEMETLLTAAEAYFTEINVKTRTGERQA